MPPGGAALARIHRALQRPELLRELRSAAPLVRVGPSGLAGAGDGVFVVGDVLAGTPLTWTDFPLRREWLASVVPYEEDYWDWYARLGMHEGADAALRNAAAGGVGHVINDFAVIEAMPGGVVASKHAPGEVRNYLRASEAGANAFLAPAPCGPSKIVFAERDLFAGDEVFRFYGPNYWLGPIETMSHFVAQFARCDVRLLAARRNSPLLHARAMALYDASVNRIRDLAGELEDIRRTEPHAAFPLTQPETAFDGYGVYHWVMLLDPALRAAYVQKLDLDARYLEPDERRDMLELRSLSRDAYFEAFCKSLPPYGQEHLLGALRADGRLEFSTRCPW